MKKIAEWIIGIAFVLCICLLVGVSLRSCNCGHAAQQSTHDTLFIKRWKPVHDTIFIPSPALVKIIPAKAIPPEYIPDTNAPKLRRQYDGLLTRYLEQNIYRDTFTKDSTTVMGTHIVERNHLISSAYSLSGYKPETQVIITNNNTYLPNRQLYIVLGANYMFTPATNAIGITGGVAYKDAHDRLYTGTYSINTLQQHRIEFTRAFKINFNHKK